MNPKNSIEPKKEISPNKNSPNQDFKGMTKYNKANFRYFENLVNLAKKTSLREINLKNVFFKIFSLTSS